MISRRRLTSPSKQSVLACQGSAILISSSTHAVERHHAPIAKTEHPKFDASTAILRTQTLRPELTGNPDDEPTCAERLNPYVANASTECVDQIQAALAVSQYPLRDVWCRVERSSLILNGFVRRYHHIQISLKVAERYCGTLRIINNIQVSNSQIIS
jgi:hypothetical protein